MLGRDIEIIKEEKLPEKIEPKIFYLGELSYDGVFNKNNPRPPSEPTIGMPKIRAKGWKAYLVEYFSSSSLHGLNHLAAPNRHFVERIFTVILIIGALIALILLSLNFWDQYQTDATVILLDHNFYKYKIVQPSIVLCSFQGVNTAKFPEVFKKYGVEDTQEMRNFFMEISRKSYMYNKTQPEVVNVPSESWLAILNDLKNEITYAAPETRQLAQWIITERGFCHQLYSYISPYSNFEYWQSNNWTVIPNTHDPSRLCSFLSKQCVSAVLIKLTDVFFGVAHPGNIIDFKKKKYKTATRHISSLRLTVDEITNSEDVKALSIKQRNCKFADEVSLRMWPIYTFEMCKSECIYRRMYEICGCHHHFARPVPGIPTCNIEQLRCVANNSKEIIEIDRKKARKCGCFRDCHYVRYAEESASTYLINNNSPLISSLSVETNFPINKYKREVIFGFIDFLAAVGGAAGLVLGASVLSFVEFFYFGTLRLYWHRVKTRYLLKKREKNSRKLLRKTNYRN